jgi:two-component system, NtrC family, response regulator HydG
MADEKEDAADRRRRCRVQSMGFVTVGAGSWAEAQKQLSEVEPSAIILDYKLPDSDAPHILAELRNQYPVIVLTGYGSIPNAVSAIREGAADFLTKPVNLDELELTVRRVLETAELRESNRFYRTQLASHRPGPMVFESEAMHKVQEMIDAVGPTDTTVLILGESGTGKEMVAQAIHERSSRAARELVAIDGSGLQENLFESELFGHERGAFTGADRQKKGLIERCRCRDPGQAAAGAGDQFLPPPRRQQDAQRRRPLRYRHQSRYRGDEPCRKLP